MSALADALVAAQRRALSALSKSYVHLGDVENAPGRDAFRAQMDRIGLTDKVEQDQLIACLEVIRAMGGEPAAEPRGNGEAKPPEKASDPQVRLIQRKLHERQFGPLAEQDIRNLSKSRASQLIDAIDAGTYDPTEWDVPI